MQRIWNLFLDVTAPFESIKSALPAHFFLSNQTLPAPFDREEFVLPALVLFANCILPAPILSANYILPAPVPFASLLLLFLSRHLPVGFGCGVESTYLLFPCATRAPSGIISTFPFQDHPITN